MAGKALLEDHSYATWTAQSDTSTPPISTRGPGRRWRMIAVHDVWPSKNPKPKEQPMPKPNDNATMNIRSRMQIEQFSSQSSHADTAEGNWRLVLANYPMKELVQKNVERFVLMSYSKPRRPPMIARPYQISVNSVFKHICTIALKLSCQY